MNPGFAAAIGVQLFPVTGAQHLDGLHLLLREGCVQARKFLIGKALESRKNVFQLVRKRNRPVDLVLGRAAIVANHTPVDVAEKLPDSLFARNRAAFLGRHDLAA